jgi:cytochrome P450
LSTTETPTPQFDELDLLSQEFLANPNPTLEKALDEAPVFFMPQFGFWAVTRYEDVKRVLSDYETFSQNAATMLPPPADLADRISPALLMEGLATADPPFHTTLRRPVNDVFKRRHVNEMEPVIEQIASSLIDGFADRGRCDLLREYFYEVSQRTVLKFIGLPDDEETLPRYHQWGDDEVALFTARPRPGEELHQFLSDEELRTRWSRLADASDFLSEICDDRRRNPKDDLITDLIGMKDERGEPLFTETQVLGMIMILVTAGTHATAISMAQLLVLLESNPEQYAEARTDRAALRLAVEEGLRLRGPGIGLFRWTTRDVEVAGVTIPKDSLVMAMFCSSGLDERKFECPMQFDIHRDQVDEHLAFGHGRHFCLGAPLARLEADIAMRTLFDRLPDLRIVPGQHLSYAPSIIAFMLERLEVEWTPGGSEQEAGAVGAA